MEISFSSQWNRDSVSLVTTSDGQVCHNRAPARVKVHTVHQLMIGRQTSHWQDTQCFTLDIICLSVWLSMCVNVLVCTLMSACLVRTLTVGDERVDVSILKRAHIVWWRLYIRPVCNTHGQIDRTTCNHVCPSVCHSWWTAVDISSLTFVLCFFAESIEMSFGGQHCWPWGFLTTWIYF